MLGISKILFIAIFIFLSLFSLSKMGKAYASVCERNRPTLQLSGDNGTTGNPGQKLTYTVKVTNNDKGADCPTSSVDISVSILNNSNNSWRAALEKTEFTTIAPGVTKEAKLFVTSPADAKSGAKTITISAKRPQGALITYNSKYTLVAPEPSPGPTTAPEAPLPTSAAQPGHKLLKFRIGIDGIGTTPAVPSNGNKNPDNIFRALNFRIYNAEINSLNFSVTNLSFTYNPANGKFERLYDFPDVANVPNGLYNLYVDGPRFLRAKYPESVSIREGQTTDLTSNNFYLTTGNINNTDLSEDKIDLMDYNVLLSCSVYSQDLTACSENQNYQDYSDLNDDGTIDEDDFALWLKEFASQQSVVSPE